MDDLIFATLTSPGNGQEPSEFLIPADRMLGYRPVHRKLIGVAWQGPLDPFWSLVYRICGVTGGHDFSMVTHCGEKVRPYFDAGIIVVRPEHGLLTVRHRVFREAHLRSDFQEFYRENHLYAIFIHQAILTGVLLAELGPEEMLEFSPRVNYPLHLHADVAAGARPARE